MSNTVRMTPEQLEQHLPRMRQPLTTLNADQRQQLREYLSQQVDKARAAAEEATRYRPSYAPAGRRTQLEQGTQAVLDGAQDVLVAYDAWLKAQS